MSCSVRTTIGGSAWRGGETVVPASLQRDGHLASPRVSVDGLQVAHREDLSNIRTQLEALHGVVERLLSNGIVGKPHPFID